MIALQAPLLRPDDILRPMGLALDDALRAALDGLARQAGAGWRKPARPALLLADPRSAVGAMIEQTGISTREAAWLVSRRFAEALAPADGDAPVVLTERELRLDPAWALTRVLSELGLPASQQAVDAACRPLAPASTSQQAPSTDPWIQALAVFEPASPHGAVWDAALFQDGDRPGQPCPAEIDVTGRARILAYGPYLCLYPGRWTVTARFTLCADAARRPYRLQLAVGQQTAEAVLSPTAPGQQALSVEALVKDAAPADLRLWVDRAAFHGSLRFAGAEVQLLGAAPQAVETA